MRPSEARGQTLDPAGLYEGDNGRIFCSDPACAGASAAFTGWTISGLKVRRLGAADRQEWMNVMGRLPRCEGCGREETR